MALKFLKSITLLFALALFVGASTLCVQVPTAVAATGSGGCTNGDPDSPKDTAPKQASATSQVVLGSISRIGAPQTQSRSEWVRWVVVNQILNSLIFGPPGRMR